MSPKVGSPPMSQLALLQRCSRISSDERNRMRTIEPTQATIAHPTAPTIIFLAPTKDQGGFTRYARFTSSDALDGSSNRNCLLHDLMKLSTLRMFRSFSNGCGRSTTTTQNESSMKQRSSDRRSCGSSEREVQ